MLLFKIDPLPHNAYAFAMKVIVTFDILQKYENADHMGSHPGYLFVVIS